MRRGESAASPNIRPIGTNYGLTRTLLSYQCFLACHKRCLETLAIQCGHKKLQGRLQLFGREFSQVASCASDGIPFIITKCVSEIERRALKMKVRVCDETVSYGEYLNL